MRKNEVFVIAGEAGFPAQHAVVPQESPPFLSSGPWDSTGLFLISPPPALRKCKVFSDGRPSPVAVGLRPHGGQTPLHPLCTSGSPL